MHRSAAVTGPPAAALSGSRRLGDFVAGLRWDSVPADVIEAATLHVVDTVGVGIAGAALPGEADSARASAEVFAEKGGRAEASAFGLPERLPAASAAYVNASLEHALDFDDLHLESRVHASTMTVPAALAVAERVGADGRAALLAVIAGNEVAARIGMGGPRHFQLHGFHGTPVAGVFGAAAAAGALLGLGGEQIAHAFGIAADTAGGTNAWIAEGTSNKHLHAGWAAHNGILSAELAAAGAMGPSGSLEGRFGLYEALTHAEQVDLEPVLATLGREWETPRMAYKAYPACYWAHGSIDAAKRLRPDILASLDQVETIEAIVPTPAVSIVLEPRETRIRPLTPYAAKFSLPYSVAAMILRGQVDLTTYAMPAMADPDVLALAARITWRVREALDEAPQVYPGGLRVRFADGRELESVVLDPTGTQANPMTTDEVLQKFRLNAGFGLASDEIAQLERELLRLREGAPLTGIGALMRAVAGGSGG